jgi:hypothetical protein
MFFHVRSCTLCLPSLYTLLRTASDSDAGTTACLPLVCVPSRFGRWMRLSVRVWTQV